MFTGIVTDVGEVRSVEPRADNLHRITIACAYPRAELIDGASIACSGVCLTVVGAGEEDGRTWFAVDAAAETLARHHRRPLAARQRASISNARSSWATNWAAIWSPAMSTASPAVVAREDLTDMARFTLARAGASWRASSRPRARSRSTASRSPSTRSTATPSRC